MSAVLLLEKSASAAEVTTSRYTISETTLVCLIPSSWTAAALGCAEDLSRLVWYNHPSAVQFL